jgi:inner membrane protein
VGWSGSLTAGGRRGVCARQARPKPQNPPRPQAPQPIHWGWLYLTALLAALSHLLLDWTNNYGLRPFFPFNPRWYAGSFVFIAEPVLWALLLMAMIIPGCWGWRRRDRRAPQAFRGRGWAIFALTGMVMLWGWRWAEQGRRAHAGREHAGCHGSGEAHGSGALPHQPLPLARDSGDRWTYYQTAEINTHTGSVVSDPFET